MCNRFAWICVLFFIFPGCYVVAQGLPPSLPFHTIELDDLKGFAPSRSKNWRIGGNVISDKLREADFKLTDGKGILAYFPTKGQSETLTSQLKHKDIDLELDFLLSKGSSFELSLPGGHIIWISDQWMKKGGNGMKAPGLWQHLSIGFIAPRFDLKGKKIYSGKIKHILLNGQPFASDTPFQRTSANAKEEIPEPGPFTITGNTKPFAIRNLKYKTYAESRITLSQMNFRVYAGLHKNPDTLATLKPKRTGTTDTISHLVGDRKSQLVIEGYIDVPLEGNYLFKLIAGGGAWLYIAEKLVIDNLGTRDFERAFYATTRLKKGKLPFRVVYSNSDECLVIHYEGPQIPWQPLTTPASVRLSEQFEPLEYVIKNKAAMQRGFMIHHEKVNPYAAAIGIPALNGAPETGISFAYDMKKYSLLAAWHGKFIDVSNMWRERGEKQMEIALGAKLEFSGKPLISRLKDPDSTWPDSIASKDAVYTSRSYRIDTEGLPTFSYVFEKTRIEDFITALPGRNGLNRTIAIQCEVNPEQMYLLLAEGKVIEKLSESSFIIDDKSFYMDNLQSGNLRKIIRQDGHLQQLLLALPQSGGTLKIKYDLIW